MLGLRNLLGNLYKSYELNGQLNNLSHRTHSGSIQTLYNIKFYDGYDSHVLKIVSKSITILCPNFLHEI
jgi:hypothetical protein